MKPRKVRRLPVDPGPAAWNRLLPPPPPAEPLQEDITADICIVGAGFAGLAAAYRLTRPGYDLRIVMLDATRVGEGPAGRNSGFMIDLPHDLSSRDYGGAVDADRLTIADNRRAIALASGMARSFGLSAEAFDPCGKINAAATEAGHRHNIDYARHLDALGEPCRLLSAQEMADLTGTDYYRSGLQTPGTVMLQPALFVRGVADGLRREGVRICENSPVTGLTRRQGWQFVHTPAGTVRAGQVILAVNGHLESFGYRRGRLMQMHTYASMTRALTRAEVARLGGAPRWGVTPADPLGTTVRRISGTGGDRIVIRNRFTFDPDLQAPPMDARGILRDHDRAFAARFPKLRGVEMEYRWGGRLCLSRNNVQVIGEVEPALYAACCQNGLGTVRGTLAGLLVAEAILGERSDALGRALTAPPPSRLPPAALSRVGATARIRWGELRAGAEL